MHEKHFPANELKHEERSQWRRRRKWLIALQYDICPYIFNLCTNFIIVIKCWRKKLYQKKITLSEFGWSKVTCLVWYVFPPQIASMTQRLIFFLLWGDEKYMLVPWVGEYASVPIIQILMLASAQYKTSSSSPFLYDKYNIFGFFDDKAVSLHWCHLNTFK